jgi:hypothetical protein
MAALGAGRETVKANDIHVQALFHFYVPGPFDGTQDEASAQIMAGIIRAVTETVDFPMVVSLTRKKGVDAPWIRPPFRPIASSN